MTSDPSSSQGRRPAASRAWPCGSPSALGGIVINADSMQVYRELRILTARPSAAGGGPRPARALWLRCRRRALLGGALCRRCRARAQEARAQGPAADHRRRHGALFQDADRGAVAHAAGARRRARALAHAGGQGGSRASFIASSRARDPEMAAAARPRRHAADRARAGGARRVRRVARSNGSARPREPVLDAAADGAHRRGAGARRALPAHRCALRGDDGRRAHSRKCSSSPRWGSIPRCRS